MAITTQPLAQRHCRPCEKGEPPLGADEARRLHRDVPDWTLGAKELRRDLKLEDFRAVIDLVDRIADIAEEEGHHPDLLVHGYKQLRITLSTHNIGGLSANDFILAAKIDRLL